MLASLVLAASLIKQNPNVTHHLEKFAAIEAQTHKLNVLPVMNWSQFFARFSHPLRSIK